MDCARPIGGNYHMTWTGFLAVFVLYFRNFWVFVDFFIVNLSKATSNNGFTIDTEARECDRTDLRPKKVSPKSVDCGFFSKIFELWLSAPVTVSAAVSATLELIVNTRSVAASVAVSDTLTHCDSQQCGFSHTFSASHTFSDTAFTINSKLRQKLRQSVIVNRP